MTNAKHTPGPWYACQWGAQVDIGTFPSGQGMVARVAPDRDRSLGIPDPQDSANARLIAAAPDLLAACEALAEWGDVIRQNYPEMLARRDFVKEARAAIARATGDES